MISNIQKIYGIFNDFNGDFKRSDDWKFAKSRSRQRNPAGNPFCAWKSIRQLSANKSGAELRTHTLCGQNADKECRSF